jgi:hypothetical protein
MKNNFFLLNDTKSKSCNLNVAKIYLNKIIVKVVKKLGTKYSTSKVNHPFFYFFFENLVRTKTADSK